MSSDSVAKAVIELTGISDLHFLTYQEYGRNFQSANVFYWMIPVNKVFLFLYVLLQLDTG